MAGRPTLLRHLVIFVAVLLLVGSSTGTAAASRERYEPPTATAVPTTAGTLEPIEIEFEPTGDVESDATIVPEGAISAPAVDDGAAPQGNVRPKPESRPFELEEPTAEDQPAEDPNATEQAAAPIRLDDPVLRWLPEILAAATATGTPAHIIAGVMRLESNGNPNIISPAGARGQMQIMPSNLIAMGIPEYLWHDPASNVMAGGYFLASRAAEQGSWEGAVGAYFGFGCDVFGTCTETYISVAMSWAYYYLPAIQNPLNSGYAVLPAGWVPPPIEPFVEAAPPVVQTPPATPPTPVATPTPTPGETPPAPGETPVPTEVPTLEPTPDPTEVPTEIPTEIPTEVPTEVPTEPPAEPPVEEVTPAA
jgi:hypothetical protein